jgi:hypothetical protein
MERKRTPLREIIPNKIWKVYPPIIRGHPPTKGVNSDLLPRTSKRSNSCVTGKQNNRPKV